MDPLTIGIIVAVTSWVVLILLAALLRGVWRLFVQMLSLLVRVIRA